MDSAFLPTSIPMWVLACLVLVVGCAHSHQTNAVVEYLTGAERQGETDEQMAELRRALDDLSRLPPNELRTRRYADYQLTGGQWTVATIVKKYLVPTHPVALDDETLVRDAQQPAARAILREHVRAIDEHRQLASP